jgi:hypothetical protein
LRLCRTSAEKEFRGAPAAAEEVSRGYLEEEMIETFRRYIPKSEVAALNAELTERTEASSGGSCQQEATERMQGNAVVASPSEEGAVGDCG